MCEMNNIDKFINELINCINYEDSEDINKKNIKDYLLSKQINTKGNLITLKSNPDIKTRGRPRKKLLCIDNNNNNIPEVNDDKRTNEEYNNMQQINNDDTQKSYIFVRMCGEKKYKSVLLETFDVNGLEC